jgi:hypothetical protein
VEEDGSFLMAWDEEGQASLIPHVFVRHYGPDGLPLGPHGYRRPPLPEMNAMRIARCLLPLLLLAGPAVLLAQKPLGDSFQVNPPGQAFGFLPHVAADSAGEFVVTWIAPAPGAPSPALYARRFAADGRPATGAIRVAISGELAYPWVRDQTGVAMMADGSFVVVFPKGPDRDSYAIVARRYGPGGAREAEVLVTPAASVVSVAALGDGGVAVTWQTPNPPNLWIRSFGPDLTPRGPAFEAEQYASSPGVAASPSDPSGEFVMAWQGFDSNSQSLFIGAQTFAADGTPGKRIRVANPSYNDTSFVYAGMDGDGNFLVAWAENSAREADPVFARRFRADGAPLGGEFPLDLGGKGFLPSSLAMGGRGNFVLTWKGPGSTSGNDTVFARRFAADGSPLGPVIPAVPDAPGHRIAEQAAIGMDGGFVVVWSSSEVPGEQVFARRFRRK